MTKKNIENIETDDIDIETESGDNTVRLVKIIAEAGISSRRKCENHIQSGRVRVNNKVIVNPAYKVNSDDEVSFDREIISRETKHYLVLYKPKGVVSSTKDLPGGRRLITEFFQDIKERLFYAGRLDSESRGIMIITNDGALANIITHPSYEVMKVYDVTISGKVDPEKIIKASNGVTIKNIDYSPFKFKILSKGHMQSKVRMTINEGKNREIRKIFEFLEYKIIDLERISVGIVSKTHQGLGTLDAGHTRKLTTEEVEFFFNQKNNAKDSSFVKYSSSERKEKEENELKRLKEKKEKTQNKSKWAKAKLKPNKNFKKTKSSSINKNVRQGKSNDNFAKRKRSF